MKPILLLIACLFSATSAFANSFTLTSIAALGPEHNFWNTAKTFQNAVSSDLNLVTLWDFADNNQIKAVTDLRSRMASDQPVNGGLIVNFKGQGENLLSIADQYEIPVISNFIRIDSQKSGVPRGKHKFWIGEVFVDEVTLGYQLAKHLIRQAEKQNLRADDGNIYVVAISGFKADDVAHKREEGLLKAIAEEKKVVFQQIVPTVNWSTEEGCRKIGTVLNRYPKSTVVWSGNDSIALGVIKGAKEAGKIPGKDILTGGIDWLPEALEAIESGQMVCSLGGNFMHGGIATILLYDYLNGCDFVQELGVHVEIQPVVITKDNVNFFAKKIKTDYWKEIDFKMFSKTLNPKLKKYDFSLKHILSKSN